MPKKEKKNGIDLLYARCALLKADMVSPLSPAPMVHVSQPLPGEEQFEVNISLSLPAFDDPQQTPGVVLVHKPSKEKTENGKVTVREIRITYASSQAAYGPYHHYHVQLAYRLQKHTQVADMVRVHTVNTASTPNPE